ncbi:hypothetical protein B0H66DRAFT_546403 [Apodospora peruviana]|uniref:Uncharacterized protein n=1 Tax=Apodospora peruviana TaxID=516989 RepID=A0AAE0MG69_9PEZI|nr:hypothetical protein B0H66DRAFT_546403 [Apodospora peruviana]
MPDPPFIPNQWAESETPAPLSARQAKQDRDNTPIMPNQWDDDTKTLAPSTKSSTEHQQATRDRRNETRTLRVGKKLVVGLPVVTLGFLMVLVFIILGHTKHDPNHLHGEGTLDNAHVVASASSAITHDDDGVNNQPLLPGAAQINAVPADTASPTTTLPSATPGSGHLLPALADSTSDVEVAPITETPSLVDLLHKRSTWATETTVCESTCVYHQHDKCKRSSTTATHTLVSTMTSQADRVCLSAGLPMTYSEVLLLAIFGFISFKAGEIIWEILWSWTVLRAAGWVGPESFSQQDRCRDIGSGAPGTISRGRRSLFVF